MITKKQKQLRRKLRLKALECEIANSIQSVRLEWLTGELKKAEEVNDTVKQNLILQSITELQGGMYE